MDALTNYIQKGKKLTFLKMLFVFFLLMVLIVGVAGIRLNYELNEPDFKAFLTEIPTIEIGEGAVIKPENTLWERKLSDEKFLFKIDTTRDEADNLPENGMVLTQHNLIFTLNDQVKQYPLPQEKVVIDTPFLTKLVRMLIFNTCLVIGFILLIVFLLGQASTSMLTSFCLWLFKKEFPAEKIRRSAFVGWLSVVFLNVALRMVNHGFTLIVCVCIATGISVFSLIWTNKEN